MIEITIQSLVGYATCRWLPKQFFEQPAFDTAPLDSHRNLFCFRSVNAVRAKDEVDPNRFTGKSFTRRNAFPNTHDDYCILIDGLNAGRIMKMVRAGRREVWFWTLTGPYFPGPNSHDGEEDTFEAARDEFKKVFWKWHAWAVQQPGKATWYGADE